ncbi:unnamed protein product, partial [Adineta ricciae]
MYLSLQTVCGCHGYLLFESIHCDRCRSLIPHQISDESLTEPSSSNNASNGIHMKSLQSSKHASEILTHYQRQQGKITTGRVRFRALCPFCNSGTYVLRYYCRRERIYYHLRVQNFGENEQSTYRSISESQNAHNRHHLKHGRKASSMGESADDSYSLTGSLYHQPPSTILYDQSGIPNAKDIQMDNEKSLYALNDLEGDLFSVLRNGLFYDTIIQCQDNVKLQVHRCILGGRSPWFRHLLGEYHDSDSQDDYVLQISIDDVQSDVMNEILNFIYTNRCLISLKNASDLLVAAKRFEIEKLRKQVSDFLLTRLTIENAIELLISAHESGSDSLKNACIRLINRNAEKIKRTEKWRTFKAEYVDLVPELYESRIERLVPVSTAFLPDVFSGPAVPSESLQTLTKLYENPVKRRHASPTVRTMPTSRKHSASRSPTPTADMHHQSQEHESITIGTSGSFVQHTERTLPSVTDRNSPARKTVVSKTKRRPAPTPAAPAQMRTFHPSVKPNSDADLQRRSIHQHEKSTTGSTNTPKQQPPTIAASQKTPQTTTTTAQQKAPPSTQQKAQPLPSSQKHPPPTQQKAAPIARQKSIPPTQPPPPPSLPPQLPHKSPSLLIQRSPSLTSEKPLPSTIPAKMSRGVSPRYIIEIRESPTLSDPGEEERIQLTRER